MSAPSSKSHLYRLGFLLAAFFVAFLLVRAWATPDSWNYDVWFREDALIDIANQPLSYGGNESCKTCHKAAYKLVRKRKHRGLSCESCHGALADHVRDNQRFAAAAVDKSRWQCENCHAEQINRPRGFPQFSKTGEIGKEVSKHINLDPTTPCLKCHDAHDPEP